MANSSRFCPGQEYDDTEYKIDIDIPDQVTYEGVTIHYVPKSEMEDQERVYHKRSDGKGWNLLRFIDNPVTTITMVAPLIGKVFSILNVWYIFSIMYPTAGEIYPPGTITSIRHPPLYKGGPKLIRGADGGVFKNVIIMNVWISEGRFISVKLSTKTIAIVGVQKEEIGAETVNHVVAHLRDAMEFHRLLKTYPQDFIEAANFVIDNSKGEKIETTFMDMENDCLTTEIDYHIRWTLDDMRHDESVPILSQQYRTYFANEIRRRYMPDLTTITTINQLQARLSILIGIPGIATNNLGIKKIACSMINYNYKLDIRMTRRVLTEKLCALGYSASFLNSERPDIRITTVSDVTIDSDSIIRRENQYIKQTFTIYHKGSCMHSGTGRRSMEDRYYDVMTNLILLNAEVQPHMPLIPVIKTEEASAQDADETDYYAEYFKSYQEYLVIMRDRYPSYPPLPLIPKDCHHEYTKAWFQGRMYDYADTLKWLEKMSSLSMGIMT